MNSPSSEYDFIRIDANDSDLTTYRDCFNANGSQKDLPGLRWIHLNNPTGKNMIYFAMFKNDLAAIYTAIPVFFKFNDRQIVSLQSIDTITAAKHRGKRLFPTLAQLLYQDAANQSFEFVYGFPNENSAPGFFNKLGWISFGEAPFLIKPMRIQYFLKRFFKFSSTEENVTKYTFPTTEQINHTTEIKAIDFFDASYDAIWKNASSKISIAVQRNAGYLNWRYVEKPGENYYRYAIYIDGRMEGVIVFAIKNKHGGQIGYIMELIYNPVCEIAGSLLVQFANKSFKSVKTDAVLAWCFAHSFNFNSYTKNGFFRLPIRLRPQHLFFGLRPLQSGNKEALQDVRNWYISYSDSDTV